MASSGSLAPRTGVQHASHRPRWYAERNRYVFGHNTLLPHVPYKLCRIVGNTRSGSALDVHFSGNGFKMFRIDAGPHAAEVVKIKPFRYRPAQLLKVVAMSRLVASATLGVIYAAIRNISVARGMERTLPYPARRFVSSVLFNVIGRLAQTGVAYVVPSQVATRLIFYADMVRRSFSGRVSLIAASTPAKAVRSVSIFFPPSSVFFGSSGYSFDDALQSGCPRSGSLLLAGAFACPDYTALVVS